MASVEFHGDVKAGRDSIIKVHNEQHSKSFDQLSPDELRMHFRGSQNATKVQKKKIFHWVKISWILFIFGLIALGIMGFLVNEMFISYSEGKERNIQVGLKFIWNQIGQGTQIQFFASIAGFILFCFLFIVIPVLMTWRFIWGEDPLLVSERQYRRKIEKRIFRLENSGEQVYS